MAMFGMGELVLILGLLGGLVTGDRWQRRLLGILPMRLLNTFSRMLTWLYTETSRYL